MTTVFIHSRVHSHPPLDPFSIPPLTKTAALGIQLPMHKIWGTHLNHSPPSHEESEGKARGGFLLVLEISPVNQNIETLKRLHVTKYYE